MNESKGPSPLQESAPVQQRIEPQRESAHDDRARTFAPLHPWSGGLLLFIDNLFFGGEALTLGLAWPVLSAVAFMITFTGVHLTQRHVAGDKRGASLAKAFLCGVLAGVPTSIAGTAVGGLVLLSSGLSSFGRKRG